MVQRLTYRRRHCYATKSNKTRLLKTPGGKTTLHYTKKRAQGPQCGSAYCKTRLQGIPRLRPKEYRGLASARKSVNRAYGGVLCANCVKLRIVRAFLVEEQKIVKKVLAIQTKKAGGDEKKK